MCPYVTVILVLTLQIYVIILRWWMKNADYVWGVNVANYEVILSLSVSVLNHCHHHKKNLKKSLKVNLCSLTEERGECGEQVCMQGEQEMDRTGEKMWPCHLKSLDSAEQRRRPATTSEACDSLIVSYPCLHIGSRLPGSWEVSIEFSSRAENSLKRRCTPHLLHLTQEESVSQGS